MKTIIFGIITSIFVLSNLAFADLKADQDKVIHSVINDTEIKEVEKCIPNNWKKEKDKIFICEGDGKWHKNKNKFSLHIGKENKQGNITNLSNKYGVEITCNSKYPTNPKHIVIELKNNQYIETGGIIYLCNKN